MRRLFVLVAAVFLAMGSVALWGSAPQAAEQASPAAKVAKKAVAVLQNSDCVKCHPAIVGQIQAAGGKHKTEVTCLDCHEGGHPPATAKGAIIPKCSKCHEGKAHFKLPRCLRCHRNPHQPLKIVFKGKVKAACKTCHLKEVQEVNQHPSAHSKVDCSFCHVKHGFIPNCLTKCHKPHRKGQTFKDCVSCHKVHQPLPATYGDQVANKQCGACHGKIEKLLESGSTKHAKLHCVFCHKGTHGMIPKCQDCHGTPHPATMMTKFKKCLDCHVNPHNLTT
ncbi:hypothetical protein BMS3Bbin14_00511 [bacterium BMS3Bbin14]|nr:hypothetical protein BMS3Abin13_00344 [bacterium BMS3Abin13]GBE52053.1 hypothetical protein BMS3Bbin14_00511 [bacterium BMS3Bbin14]HDL98068.1 cytochrome C [Desulfobacteraceae bacterium]HDO31488.1 cytochrome C [Desulfobacteraceae bacterium]